MTLAHFVRIALSIAYADFVVSHFVRCHAHMFLHAV